MFDAALQVLSLEECVTDYEPAIWIAVTDVFENVKIIGCAWICPLRLCIVNCQKLAYQIATRTTLELTNSARKLMKLVYLPPLHIVPMFDKLRHSMNESEFLLTQLCDYFERTWLKNTIWQVDDISVFMQPIRTNNDIEGCHRRLNSKARRGKLQFYLLSKLLRKEADLVDVTASLVSQSPVLRQRRKKH